MRNEEQDRRQMQKRKQQSRKRRRRRRRRSKLMIRRRRIMLAAITVAVTVVAVIIIALIARHQAVAEQTEKGDVRLSAGVNAEIAEILEESSRHINHAAATPIPTPGPTIQPELTSSPKADEESAEAIWTGWAYFESGDAGWEQVGGDGGNAYGRFQLDARHSLAAFLRYAAETNPDFVGLERYYRKNGSKTTLQSTDGLADDWLWISAVYGSSFYQMQAEFAYGAYYCLMRDQMLEKYEIDLDAYGPVLKGTIWSVAVRNGNNLSSIYSVTETYYPGIDEEEWLREIYAVEAWRHPDQVKRWEDGQLNAALDTLAALESDTEVEFHRDFEKDAVQDTGRIEFLSLEGDYRDFVRYTGRSFE